MLDALIKAAATAGPFGVLLALYIWWGERAERRELSKQLAQMTAGGIKAMNGMEDALNALADTIGVKRSRRRSRR